MKRRLLYLPAHFVSTSSQQPIISTVGKDWADRACESPETNLGGMSNLSNSSELRYGFDLDRSCFLDIGMRLVAIFLPQIRLHYCRTQLIVTILNTIIIQPFPLYILLRKSPTMSAVIRRGYLSMHVSEYD